jgi:O-antigen/teichoic acid export membrane protein
VRAACRSGLRYLVVLAAPAIALILGAADLLLGWWLGEEFRANSGGVARLLALGMLASIVAQVPLTALNAVGRASVSAKIAACELPFYVATVWFAASRFGIEGVAAAWALRAAIDAAVLFFAAHRTLPAEAPSVASQRLNGAQCAVLCAFLGVALILPLGFGDSTSARLAALGALLIALVGWEWRVLLRRDDRAMLRLWYNRLLSPAR